jgi:hypothetical protein
MLVQALLLSALVASTDAASVTLHVEVTRGGDVGWSAGPCTLEARRGTETLATVTGDTIELTPGPTLLVVGCEAKEGIVSKSLRVDVRKEQTLKVTLNPGFLVGTIDQGGTKTAGSIVVYDDNDAEIARGADRKALAVNAGSVRIVGLVDRGAGRSVRGEAKTTIKGGARSEVTVDVADGELLVTVTENGRSQKALVGLRLPGESARFLELVPGEATAVPSGTWDVVTQLGETHDFREQVTHGVVVTPRKRTTRAINHATGTVTLKTSPATGVLIELFQPDAAAPFNQLDPGTAARLSPGRYLIKATEEGRTLDDGTKPTVIVNHTVAGGSNGSLTLTPVTATVDVEVRLGKVPRAQPVRVAFPDAAEAFITRNSDDAGVVRFLVSPSKVVVSTRLETAHGPVEVKKTVDVRGGTNRVQLTLDVGAVVHQVMDAGVAALATVSYTKKPAKKAEVPGDPLVTVKAGETAWLPPGVWLVTVERRGERRLFGEVKVVAGATPMEAVLEWAPPPAAPTTPPAAPNSDAKLDAKSDVKTDAKTDAKSDVKKTDEKKPDAKTDAKSDVKKTDEKKPDAKTDAKSDVKKPDGKKPDEKKTDAPPDAKKTDEKKTDAKKTDAKSDEKKDDKKDAKKEPAPPAAAPVPPAAPAPAAPTKP